MSGLVIAARFLAGAEATIGAVTPPSWSPDTVLSGLTLGAGPFDWGLGIVGVLSLLSLWIVAAGMRVLEPDGPTPPQPPKEPAEEDWFRAIANYTVDWESWIDTDGRLRWVNPAVERVTGYTIEECLALPGYPGALIHEEDRAAALEALNRGGAHSVGNDRTVRIRRKNGEVIWATMSWQPIFCATGQWHGQRISVRDINDRQRAEEELRRERSVFLEGPVVAFRWVARLGWPVEYVSPNVTGLFGYGPDDFLSGRVSYSSVIHADDLERVAREVAAHSQAGAAHFEQDYRIVRPVGDIRWLHDHTMVIRDDRGRVTHFQGYVFDVSERHRAEEEREHTLRELQEALGKVKRLHGMLPICSGCKRIRDDQGYWEEVEVYIRDHSEAVFSHSLCPACKRALYPELSDRPDRGVRS